MLLTGVETNGYKNCQPRNQYDRNPELGGDNGSYGTDLNCHSGKHLRIAWYYALNWESTLVADTVGPEACAGSTLLCFISSLRSKENFLNTVVLGLLLAERRKTPRKMKQ